MSNCERRVTHSLSFFSLTERIQCDNMHQVVNSEGNTQMLVECPVPDVLVGDALPEEN